MIECILKYLQAFPFLGILFTCVFNRVVAKDLPTKTNLMDARIIGPGQKDSVLKLLCTSFTPEQLVQFSVPAALKKLDLTFDEFNAIMKSFQRLGFIGELNLRRNVGFTVLQVEANDYYLRGGFAFQEDLLEKNIEKLLLEVDNLKKQLAPKHLETVNKISSISATILTGISLIKK